MPRRPWLPLVVLVVFLGSLAMPALVVIDQPLFGGSPREQTLWGIQCLLAGFFVLPGWLANPFLLVGVVLHAVRLQAAAVFVMVLAVISAVIAPFLLREYDMMRLVHVHVGYAAWLSSMVGMLVLAIRGRRVQSA